MWTHPSFDDTCTHIQTDDTPNWLTFIRTRHCSALITHSHHLSGCPLRFYAHFDVAETSCASVDPLPPPSVLLQCVHLPNSNLGLVHANLALSAVGLEPRQVRLLPLTAKQRGSRRYLAKPRWPLHCGGLFGARALAGHFTCDTSSALEWSGLFMCVASVVRVSFYSFCCTKTQRKI